MTFAVLMTCFNRVETTLRCLARLFGQKMPEGYGFDVWLVDDASPDKTGEKVKAAYSQVHVIRGTGSLFWCKGMRLAWDCAAKAKDYDGYLWLNDDVLLREDALAGLAADIAQSGEAAILVGACAVGDMITYGISGGSGSCEMLAPNGTPQRTTGAMSGNFVWVPRQVFQIVGPIYGGYSHGYGDYDYGWQADRKGVVRYLCSKVIGDCPQQPERYRHKLKGETLRERIRVLLTPNGFSLRDNFIYKYRNFGLLNALASVVHIIWIRIVLKNER